MVKEYEYTVVLEYDKEIGEYAALVPSCPDAPARARPVKKLW